MVAHKSDSDRLVQHGFFGPKMKRVWRKNPSFLWCNQNSIFEWPANRLSLVPITYLIIFGQLIKSHWLGPEGQKGPAYTYRKFSNKCALPIRAHPFFQNLKDEFMSFPKVYDMPIFNKIWVVIYRWKALELCFSNNGAPMLCLGAVRPYWRIYGITLQLVPITDLFYGIELKALSLPIRINRLKILRYFQVQNKLAFRE